MILDEIPYQIFIFQFFFFFVDLLFPVGHLCQLLMDFYVCLEPREQGPYLLTRIT